MNYKEICKTFIESAFELMDKAKAFPRISIRDQLEKRLDDKYWLVVSDNMIAICERPDEKTYVYCTWVKRCSGQWNVGRLLDKYLALLEEES